MQIAIDGPAGSGKSTVCKIIAEKFNLTYLDTGAMYRAVAWYELNQRCCNLVSEIREIDFKFSDSGKKLTLVINGEEIDVSSEIRTKAITNIVSVVASNAEIRAILTKKQQEFAKGNNVIMEGRDITTVVLPRAEVKVFLTASAEERAKRRFLEWEGKADCPTFEQLLKDIKDRDYVDSNRETAPLKQADDAIYLDTTGLSLEEVADKIGEIIGAKL